MFRTMAEGDLGRVLKCLDDPSRFERLFEATSYRPDWTWVAADGDEIKGVAVWWGFPTSERPLALDTLWAAPDVDDPVGLWAALIRRMPPPFEYHLFTSPGREKAPEVTLRLAAAELAGLGDVNERLRYQWTDDDPLPRRSTRLTFEPEPDDEEFAALFAAIAEDSLDVATREGVARLGALEHSREDIALYKQMRGPRDQWRVAFDQDGQVVGAALPSANDGGPVVGFVGVVPGQRGHGYADDLLAEITHVLAEDGATCIRADTDKVNKPMAASFERCGYQVFAIRIVASFPPGEVAGS
ncbi:Protein N-acetyltransferase, RimJ/RimL family [Paractinoplanes atraurantiacus]|uniref:Protein N-acetyltransferase, RimJ/RimL family n=1 Tax=Paractinoplanes atraurantiacus TaxID=1036182 RepID=A0A285J751_9ACTN|nr:Protein N-acetyltransferase, RimJ/RimL family [Actinoplanes atraurantiacus]